MESFVFRSRRSRVLTEGLPALLLTGWFSVLTVREAQGQGENGGVFGLLFGWAILAFCAWTSLAAPESAEFSANGMVTFHRILPPKTMPASAVARVQFGRRLLSRRAVGVMLWYAGGMLAFQAERGALRDFALALFRYNRGLRLSETRPLGESGTEEALLSLLLP